MKSVVMKLWGFDVADVGHPAADAVFDASGKFLVVAQDNGIGVYQVTQNFLSEVAGSPFASGTSFTRLKFSPTGRALIAIGEQSQQLFVFTLNGATGALAADASDLAVVRGQ